MMKPHLLTIVQNENDKLQSVNQQLKMKLDELQKQLNKVVEENVRLRSSQPQRSPTTPTSPLPVIMEPATLEEEEAEFEVAPMDVYAQVDMTKVSGCGHLQAPWHYRPSLKTKKFPLLSRWPLLPW